LAFLALSNDLAQVQSLGGQVCLATTWTLHTTCMIQGNPTGLLSASFRAHKALLALLWAMAFTLGKSLYLTQLYEFYCVHGLY